MSSGANGSGPPRLVASAAAWSAAEPALASARLIAFDLEADGFHRYPERVSLIQLALADGAIYLVDPLEIGDLSTLGEVLADPDVTKVFHAADYDIRSLSRDFGFAVDGLFDTAIAAQFAGAERTGLQNVVADRLGVDLPKPKRLQRLDWSARPLPADALEYAAADVAHLVDLFEDLHAELDGLGRLEWVAEESRRLQQVRFSDPEPPEIACLSTPGARDLTSAGRAVLRELYDFRDVEARRIGRPPHWVLSNASMIALAASPDQSPLAAGVPRATMNRAGDRLRHALKLGKSAPPLAWPRRGGRNPWDSAARTRMVALKEWRTSQAAALRLSAGIVWPMAHLKRIALNPGTDPRELDREDPPDVRDWQWRELGAALADYVASASGPSLP